MVLRTARRGRNAGEQFWGCSRYPVCSGTRSLHPVRDIFGNYKVRGLLFAIGFPIVLAILIVVFTRGGAWPLYPAALGPAPLPLQPEIAKSVPQQATPESAAISSREISVIDGDTIRARGRTIRLVGFDAPESGNQARCASERELAGRATAQLQKLVASGGLELRMVRCSCPPDTEGTSTCNYGRACGELRSHGRDVGAIMIAQSLAHPYVCGARSCPPRQSWC
jgi:endonuclease YncB( thermonuclease family)